MMYLLVFIFAVLGLALIKIHFQRKYIELYKSEAEFYADLSEYYKKEIYSMENQRQ